jgi:hypothetical protein
MSADVADLLDRDALRTLVSRYAHRVDERDVPGIVACFTPDTHVEFNGGAQVVDGQVDLARFFESAFQAGVLGERSTSTHLLTDVLVTLAGDVAHLETLAIACLAGGDSDSVVLRGLRYSDRCVRVGEDWLIDERVHRSLWQCEAPGGPLPASAVPGSPVAERSVHPGIKG